MKEITTTPDQLISGDVLVGFDDTSFTTYPVVLIVVPRGDVVDVVTEFDGMTCVDVYPVGTVMEIQRACLEIPTSARIEFRESACLMEPGDVLVAIDDIPVPGTPVVREINTDDTTSLAFLVTDSGVIEVCYDDMIDFTR